MRGSAKPAALADHMVLGVILMALSCLCCFGLTQADAAVYYVSNDGSDADDGLSPETAWRTLARVNAQPLAPGDVVRFRRGDSWRGQLIPRSGSEAGPITYTAYGEGPKPLLLGSVSKDTPEDWQDEGGGIWSTTPPKVTGPELLTDPAEASGQPGWTLYTEGGAAATGSRDSRDYHSAPASYRIDCKSSGRAGADIQFFVAPFAIEAGKTYRLSFWAKSSKPFYISAPTLMSSRPPWSSYSADGFTKKHITTTWKLFVQYYEASVSARDGRLTFFLGGVMPDGAAIHIDDVSFAECEGEYLPVDVGNIILDHEKACGVKVWEKNDLDAQGKFWYDEDTQVLKMYSTQCPAIRYAGLECALRRHIIDESGASYVVYENLALKYGGAHGIGGGDTHHIIVRDCDISYIGGGDQRGGKETVRYGNGIEFWGNAHDNLVERCRLWEIYDAALTNQNNAPNVREYNIYYRNNIIWNSEYSFEYWNRPESSVTHDIYFENNTCVGAGYGWGHTQRPDPSGRHLCFYSSPAPARNITIRNNIFFEAKGNAFYAPAWPEDAVAALRMDHNCWWQTSGVMINLLDSPYTMDQFARYQADKGKEPHSIVADPLFRNPDEHDFRLTEQSPCIDAGTDVGLTRDFAGTPVPQGAAPDMGAFELRR